MVGIVRYYICWGEKQCQEATKRKEPAHELLGNAWTAVLGFNSVDDIHKFKANVEEKLANTAVHLTEYQSMSVGQDGMWEYEAWFWTPQYPKLPTVTERRAIKKAIRQSAASVGYLPLPGVLR